MTDYNIYGDQDSIVYIINPGLSFINASLGYSFKKSLSQTLWLGAEVSNNFYYGAIGADIWFLNELSVSPLIEKLWLDGNKHKLKSSLSIPVLCYLVRQPYTLDPSLNMPNYFIMYLNTGSLVTSLNRFRKINLDIYYSYQLKTKKEIGVAYKFMLINFANYENRNLKAYSNNFSLMYTFYL
jgi:hypothetical protein